MTSARKEDGGGLTQPGANAGLSQRRYSFGLAHGVSIQYNSQAEPTIQFNHIDGPLSHGRGCQIHWLTLWERLQVRLGYADARSLELKHWPDFVERWEAFDRHAALRARQQGE